MSAFTISIAVLLALVAMADASGRKDVEIYDLENAHSIFESFINKHNKVYKDEADKELHFEAFKKNLEQINELNNKDASATFGINKFADYTDEEKKMMRGLKTSKN